MKIGKIDMDALEAVIKNANYNSYKMTNNPSTDQRKFLMLMSEIGELADSIRGKHEHPPALELLQIAGICINWLCYIEYTDGCDFDNLVKLSNHP